MKYLRTKEAAQLLDVYPSTLIRLEKRGLLKPVRDYNGRRLYERAQLNHIRLESKQNRAVSDSEQ